MTRWTMAALMLLAAAVFGRWAWADPATQPMADNSPATAPAMADQPAAGPTAAYPSTAPAEAMLPASQPSSGQSLANEARTSGQPMVQSINPESQRAPGAAPTPRIAQPTTPEVPSQWALFDLSGIAEKPADFSLFGTNDTVTLHMLVDRLELARKDNSIHGVLVTLRDPGLNLSQAWELRSEFKQLHSAGKKVFVYADEYDTTSYIAALGADYICMMEGGDIEIPGVGFQTLFAKGLLDKFGVDADYVQIGEYKGADEEYTRTAASPELTEQLNGLADSLYKQIIDQITASRDLTHADVTELVDQSLIPGKVAKARGLVDYLVDMDELPKLIASETGRTVQLKHDYGDVQQNQVDLSNPLALLSLLTRRPTETASNRPAIALIYAEGEIVDGSGGQSMLSGDSQIGSDDMRVALRMAERDPAVKAVVVRIDSPGGSALASEVIWQSLRRVAKSKPVIISVGSEAASGGYYSACGGDYIFADPTAIVGSIGVVGGKFVIKDLLDKVGINAQSFLRGRNAGLFDSTTEWTEDQRRQVTQWMQDTYEQFTERVMTTREGKIKEIDSVARGRIFSAQQAVDLGMVDRIGGLKDALTFASQKVKLPADGYEVRILPPARTIADILSAAGMGADAPAMIPRTDMAAATLSAALPASMRRALSEQLEMMVLLQQHPVILASPVMIVVK